MVIFYSHVSIFLLSRDMVRAGSVIDSPFQPAA